MKGNKKGFCNSKKKLRENLSTLLNGEGDLVTHDREKAEIFHTFFVSVFQFW